jgi:hypothetical protein
MSALPDSLSDQRASLKWQLKDRRSHQARVPLGHTDPLPPTTLPRPGRACRSCPSGLDDILESSVNVSLQRSSTSDLASETDHPRYGSHLGEASQQPSRQTEGVKAYPRGAPHPDVRCKRRRAFRWIRPSGWGPLQDRVGDAAATQSGLGSNGCAPADMIGECQRRITSRSTGARCTATSHGTWRP